MKIHPKIIHFLNWFPNQSVAFVSCAIFIIGLVAGRALMSIGMIMLLGSALLDKNLPQTVRRFSKNTAALLLTGVFFLFLISFFWSQNTSYFWNRIVLMFPFIGLPFAFQALKWKRSWFDYLAFLYILVCTLGVGWSLVQYFQNKEVIDAAYGISKSMPTPFGGDHIRFGVGVVLALSFCFQLIKKQFFSQWFLVVLAVFMIVYLHILASKTALLSLYIILFYEVIILLVRKKMIALGLVLLAIMFVMPFGFYYTSPSFQNKIGYTRYSIEQMLNTEAQTNVSDEGRIVSYQTGLDVFRQNWLLGVGVGDGQDAMERAYKHRNILTKKILYPHNQFLYGALVLGSVGLFYFMFVSIFLFKKYFRASAWLATFLLLFIVPFMVEVFLNTQYGIALFLFFFLLLERRFSLSENL